MSDQEIAVFCRDEYDPMIGARGLPGYIQARLEPIIVNSLLGGSAGGPMIVTWDKARGGFQVGATAQEKAA